jgi:hypothetical protein
MIPVILIVVSCTSFTAAPFEPEVEGYYLTAPIDKDKLVSAIKISLIHLNWFIYDANENAIQAKYVKSGGNVQSKIEIRFDNNGYSIHYIDSKGLDCDKERMLIHKNYNRWIANLNKNIYVRYLR